MPNQITFGATIAPTTAPMEVSTNGGSSFVALTFTTTGSNQQGTLTGVAPATYAAGQLVLGAVGYPATRFSNTTAVSVTGTATASPTVSNFSATPQ